MMPNSEKIISAQVMVVPRNGKLPNVLIVSQTLEEYLPSQESLMQVRDFFATSGFELGLTVGNNFSITASLEMFERFFKVRLQLQKGAIIVSVRKDGTANYELPLASLPNEIKNLLIAITFTPPPAFGPTNF